MDGGCAGGHELAGGGVGKPLNTCIHSWGSEKTMLLLEITQNGRSIGKSVGYFAGPKEKQQQKFQLGGQGGVEEVNTVRQELKENILTSGRRVGKMFIFQYVPTEQKKKRTLPGNTVGTEVFKCFVSWRQLQKLTLNWNPVLWVWMKIWLRQRTLKKYLTTLDFALLLFSSFHKVQAFTVSKGDT